MPVFLLTQRGQEIGQRHCKVTGFSIRQNARWTWLTFRRWLKTDGASTPPGLLRPATGFEIGLDSRQANISDSGINPAPGIHGNSPALVLIISVCRDSGVNRFVRAILIRMLLRFFVGGCPRSEHHQAARRRI